MVKKLSAALLGIAFVLAGCNTVSGVGKDIQAGGAKLEKKGRGREERFLSLEPETFPQRSRFKEIRT